MELQPPRGTADLLPPPSEAMLGLYEAAHRAARLFGFRYVETPTFEHTELFARTSGETSDVVTKEMYTFQDKGGRSLTLRPEQTASIVRAYLSNAHDLPNPFKAYHVSQQFRHGRPQAGRLREFRQFGVETIGVAGAGADAEVIALGDRFLRGRGLTDLELQINSIGDPECRPAYREKLIAYLEPHADELDEDCRTRLRTNPLRVFDCKVDGKTPLVLGAPLISDNLCQACAEHFAQVRNALDDQGIAFVHDPRLVRGLDYYTRTTFEFVSGALSQSAASVGGGGRYDGLAEVLGGPATPGVGYALGLDRILIALQEAGAALPGERGLACFVVAIGPDPARAGARLVTDLRNAGIPAASAFEDRPLKAQLRIADRAGAAYVAIIGEREIEAGTVQLRRLASGERDREHEQEEVPIGGVVNWFSQTDWAAER
ncbi:MAG TPA: histidine--tRNA ligase [Actinomycetota bacterium]|nr:histidine--tRNA ligase [Actinomycetota bacterium]